MARNVVRRGRMPPEDEDRIQKCIVCIEQEVEARDVTPHLLTAGIFTLEDREEINYCRTRVDRIRRLTDILIMRGPRALPEFVIALEANGYDRVAAELRDVEVKDEAVQRAPVGDRLKKVEDGWEILSRRLTRIESKVEDSSDIPANELENVKLELDDLKHELLDKVKALTKENAKKDEKIYILQAQLDMKIEDLKEAERRIQVLEMRIKELEEKMKRENVEMHGKIEKQAEIIGDQSDKLESTGKILENQSKLIQKQNQKIQKQEKQIADLKMKSSDQENRQRSTEQNLIQMSVKMNQMAVMFERERQERKQFDFVAATHTKTKGRPIGGGIVARNRFQTRPKRPF